MGRTPGAESGSEPVRRPAAREFRGRQVALCRVCGVVLDQIASTTCTLPNVPELLIGATMLRCEAPGLATRIGTTNMKYYYKCLKHIQYHY